MPKIRLKKQPEYKFSYSRTVRVGDINYGNHLSNDSVVTILHEARIDLLQKLGVSELDIGDGRTGLIMGDIAVNFKNQSYMFDELTVYSQIDEIQNASFRVFHKITRDDTTIALAETGIITFDYKTNSIGEIPESFINKLESM